MKTFKEFEEAYVKPQKITLKSNGKSYTQNVRLRPGNTHIAILHWKEIEATDMSSGTDAHTEFISGTEKSLQKTVKHHLKNRGKYIEGGEILKIPEKYLP